MRAFICLLTLLVLGAAAYAAETITYSYDSHGRLVKVTRSEAVGDDIVTSYTYDKAGNRTAVTVSTEEPTPPPPAPSFSINNASANEGVSLTFTVTKTGARAAVGECGRAEREQARL
ncbi:MAG TPA: RHS repeat domain-containing protein [Sphingomicrobium sp.]|nr:RHS repeat domain-containing protein [Sphingomicrobium sp.]